MVNEVLSKADGSIPDLVRSEKVAWAGIPIGHSGVFCFPSRARSWVCLPLSLNKGVAIVANHGGPRKGGQADGMGGMPCRTTKRPCWQ